MIYFTVKGIEITISKEKKFNIFNFFLNWKRRRFMNELEKHLRDNGYSRDIIQYNIEILNRILTENISREGKDK